MRGVNFENEIIKREEIGNIILREEIGNCVHDYVYAHAYSYLLSISLYNFAL